MNIKRIAATILLMAIAASASAAEIRGAWTADASAKEDGKAYFQFNRKGSNNGRTMQLASFRGLSTAQVRSASQVPVTFTLPAEAGTVTLEGTFKQGFGAGQFTFSPNPAFLDTVRAMGVSVESEKRRGRERDQDARLLQLALSDVSTAFIQSMRTAGYDVSLDKYLAFRIFNITPAYVRELNDLGYRDLDSDEITSFRIHKVTPEFIRGMRELGYDDIPARKLVAMRIHRVTPEFVRELKTAGYSGIPIDKLISMRIHGVDAEFAKRMSGM